MSEIDWSPVWISLKIAAITMVFTFVLGLMAAWFVYNRKREITKAVCDGIFTMPLVLPPTVAGFFLLLLFGVNGVFGSTLWQVFGIRVAFTQIGAVLASVVISFPIMYRSARAALEQVDDDLVLAGRTLGMSETRIFLKVLIPNALPGLVGGGVLSFARGLGEFGATAMIAGNIPGKTRTLSLAVYAETAAGDMDQAGVYVGIILLLCFVAVIGMNCFTMVKKKG